MGATNIPITATTTDFISAVKAAQDSIGNFNKVLNKDLIDAFRGADRADKEFQQGLGRVQKIIAQQAIEAARMASSYSSSFTSIGKSLSTYVTAPLLLAGGAAFKAYGDIDGMVRGLKAATGSAEVATAQFKDFYSLSQKPGLGLEETVQAGLQLETLGYRAQTAKKYVAEVGNAIALGGKGKVEFGQVITQFTQMAGKAKVMGDDLKPIINASPVIAKAINDMFGTVDSEQISKKLQSVGKGPKDFIESLVSTLSKLERVEGGPRNAMENFGDAAKIASYSVAGAADKVFGLTGKLNGLSNFLGNATTSFGESSTAIQATAFTVAGLAAAVGPLSLALGGLIKGYQALTLETSAFRIGLSALTSPTALAVAAAAAVAAIGYAAYQAGQPLVELVSKTELLASINKTATDSIVGERAELEHLYKVATDENRSKEERRKAIVALNQISPQYLGFLNEENISSLQASEAIRKQGEAILFRARARATEDKITELTKKRIETEQRPVSDFEKTFDAKVNPQTGMQQILSPNDIKARAQQYKNEALTAIDANIAQVESYANLNERRASRRGISVELPVSPTLNLNGGQNSAFEKLKTEVDTAKAKIEDFVAQHGPKVKIPMALQLDYTNKAQALKNAEDAVKALTPKTPKLNSGKTTSGDGTIMALLKRTENELQAKIQGLSKEALAVQVQGRNGDDPTNLFIKLRAVRDEMERLQSLTSKNQKFVLPGLSELTSGATQERMTAIIENITKLQSITPALFAKTEIKDFLTDIQRAAPSLEFLQNKIEEVRATIAALSLNKQLVPDSLVKQLEDLKKLLADATGSVNTADGMSETGDGNDSKWVAKAQKRIDSMKAAGQAFSGTATELGAQMKQAAMAFAQAGFAAFDAIGTALGSGGNPLKAALQSITDTLGNYLEKQGEALALAALFEQTAAVASGPLAPLLELPIGFQLAASAALITGGAAIKSIGKYAKGGVFRGAELGLFGEYPGAGRNPEIATPQSLMRDTFQDVLRSNGGTNPFDMIRAQAQKRQPVEMSIEMGELRVRGSDLFTALRRYKTTLQDYGGNNGGPLL